MSLAPSPTAPASALVLVSGGPDAQPAVDSGAWARLAGRLPPAAKVLQVGDDGGALRRACAATHAASVWDVCESPADGPGPGRYDLIVLARPLPRLADARAVLRALADRAGPGCALLLEVPNAADLALLQRVVEGDLTDADDGPLAQGGWRLSSPASAYKLLLDTGWMPDLRQADTVAAPADARTASALALAEVLGVPRATALQRLSLKGLCVQARRAFDDAAREPGAARFAVVVPTTRELQLDLNVEASPGLKEVGAHVVSYRRAASPAQALERSLAHVQEDWVLFCHQDVYFPSGFGEQLNAVLAAIPSSQRATTLIGFAGIGVDRRTRAYEKAGFVIDRLHCFDHAASDAAVSIDEFAVVVARDSVHRIDPALGWHLWATDLCLAAICRHEVFARVVRLPVFHNSVNDYQLPAAFHESAARLAAKYPGFGPITTLCGTIDSGPALQEAVQ